MPIGVKHGLGAYANWGCRCDVCYQAKSESNRETRERQRTGQTRPKTNKMGGKNRRNSQADAKAKSLMALAQGATTQEAPAAAGRKYSTWLYWRRTDPDFSAKAQAIINARRRHGNTTPMRNLNVFTEFRRRYFGMETYPHQAKMIEAIETAPDDSITLILAPPEAGKTSLIEDYFNFRLANDPNLRLAHISEGQHHSRKVVGRVQLRMTDTDQFEDYIKDFGPFRAENRDSPRPWNRDYFTVAKSNNGERDYSLSSAGITSKIYGSRFDLTILDDIQSQETLSTTDKLMTTIQGTLLSRGGKTGRIIVIGTRVGFRDVYSKMMEMEGFVDRYVAIPAFDDKGESYCSAMWPKEALERKASKMTPDLWAMLYMQQAGQPGTAPFSEEMVNASKDRERGTGRSNVGLEVVCSIDPALDTGKCAFLAAAMDSERFYVLDAIVRTDMARNEDIFDQMLDLTRRYRPSTWVIEINNFQKGLAYDLRLAAMAQRWGFDLQSHKTNRNKLDPVIGVKSMASSFLPPHPEVSIPWGSEEARAKMGPLCDQLLNWRPGIKGTVLEQDLVMSIWFSWILWQDRRQTYVTHIEPQWRPSWMLN